MSYLKYYVRNIKRARDEVKLQEAIQSFIKDNIDNTINEISREFTKASMKGESKISFKPYFQVDISIYKKFSNLRITDAIVVDIENRIMDEIFSSENSPLYGLCYKRNDYYEFDIFISDYDLEKEYSENEEEDSEDEEEEM